MTDTAFFTTREVPWMKLGKIVENAVSAKEAAQLGKIDFTVSLKPVLWAEDDGSTHPMANRFVARRDDTKFPLGLVSGTYEMVQYGEAFEFMDNINPLYVAAGGLKGGKQAFMVVELPDSHPINVLGGEDEHKLYVVLRTSHDKSRGVEVMVMPLRQRCMNQLTLRSFSNGVENRWSFKHIKGVNDKLKAAELTSNRVDAYRESYEKLTDRLANTEITVEWGRDMLVERVIPSHTKKKDEVADKIIEMWQGDPTVGFSSNGWGFVNAVSSYFDWERNGGTEQSRFLGSLEGQTYKAINAAAMTVLTRA